MIFLLMNFINYNLQPHPAFLTAGFLAAGFLAAGFLAAGFLATGFLATGFLAAGFLGGIPPLIISPPNKGSMAIFSNIIGYF